MYDEAIVWIRNKVKVLPDYLRSPNVVSIRFIQEIFYGAVMRAFKITP